MDEETTRIIEAHNELRERCYNVATANNGALMGSDSWLSVAMQESDMNLEPTADGIRCYGITFTTQTMSNEPFEFMIPAEALA